MLNLIEVKVFTDEHHFKTNQIGKYALQASRSDQCINLHAKCEEPRISPTEK